MNKLIYFLMLKNTFSTGKFFIRNTELPACLNCLYFIEHKNNYPYDPIPSDKKFGRCKKFGEINLVTGLIEYDYATLCRDDINRCGKIGSEYKENQNKMRIGLQEELKHNDNKKTSGK